jgi:predicted CxxxxCH...CXXCH cytochrome family protein
MKKINTAGIFLSMVVTAGMLLCFGCSKPTADQEDLGPHASGWLSQGSPDFHGTQILNSGFSEVMSNCANCHLTVAAGDTTWDCWTCHSYFPHLHTNQGIEGFQHGGAIRNANYQVGLCRNCHGQDYSGGVAGVNCTLCHAGTPEACNTCHGIFGASSTDTSSFAPPTNLLGGNDSTQVSIGAHRQHVRPQTITFEPVIGHAYACSECHVMPDSLRAASHITGPPFQAEITFGSVATEDGQVSPVWNHNQGTCSAVYCHGNFELGNPNNPAPLWTKQDGTQIACGTCHTMPPGGSHPQTTNCNQCHSLVVGPDNVTIINPNLHVNGQVN